MAPRPRLFFLSTSCKKFPPMESGSSELMGVSALRVAGRAACAQCAPKRLSLCAQDFSPSRPDLTDWLPDSHGM